MASNRLPLKSFMSNFENVNFEKMIFFTSVDILMIFFLNRQSGNYRSGGGGSTSKPTSRSQSPPSPASLKSIDSVLEDVKRRIERCEPLRMETFLQLEASAAATNNNPLINLVRDMVSTLKKSAAALVSAPNADKLDPQTIVCKCKFIDAFRSFNHFCGR